MATNNHENPVPPFDTETNSLSLSSSSSSTSSSSSSSSSPQSNLAPTPGSPNAASNSPPAKKLKQKLELTQLRTDWDPTRKITTGSASSISLTRIRRDIQEFQKNPPDGIFVLFSEADITKLDVLIIGPEGTPYQGGFFHFFVAFGTDYPFQPPRVKLMTTDNGKVRFNPNFYNNGKICLSILHTWNGPRWSASQTLTSLLCSIQSLMTEKPYQNEPGHEKMKAVSKEAQDYLNIIRHETIRVAVCDTVAGLTRCPKPFVEYVAVPEFVRQYNFYLETATKRRGQTSMDDFLGGCRGPFDFNELETRLSALYSKLNPESGSSDASNAASISTSASTNASPTHCASASTSSVLTDRVAASSASASGLHSITVGDYLVIGLLDQSAPAIRKITEKLENSNAPAKADLEEEWDFNAISDESELSEYEEDDEDDDHEDGNEDEGGEVINNGQDQDSVGVKKGSAEEPTTDS